MGASLIEKVAKSGCSTPLLEQTKLVLVGEGIFPITKDAKGNELKDLPNTGIAVAGTIQGEGKLAGTPSLFIRLASCNLRCIWQMSDGSFCKCDTSYASFHPDDKKNWSVKEILETVKNNIGNMEHVVVTGGEPLLQKKGLALLCKELNLMGLHVTVETNGTLFDEDVAQWVDLYSISPKLSNSVPNAYKLSFYKEEETGSSKYHHEVRRNIKALQSYIDFANKNNKDLQLKFVVGKQTDADEILKDYLKVLYNYKKQDVLLMPLGATHDQIAVSNPLVLKLCIENGWKYSPRVHIEIFGSKKGV